MDRKDFFKKSCQAGLCACAGLTVFSQTGIMANTNGNDDKTKEWQVGFMQRKFAKLVDTLTSNLDAPTRNRILEQMGRACSKEGEKDTLKFKGDVEGFLNEIKKSWVEQATFNKEKSEIKIIGKKSDTCFCPFASKTISKDFCNCSKGWQKETFEAILGKPVDVTIDSSLLKRQRQVQLYN